MVNDTLYIDLETRSKVGIEHGIYRYASDPSFKILVLAAKLNDQPTQSTMWTGMAHFLHG